MSQGCSEVCVTQPRQRHAVREMKVGPLSAPVELSPAFGMGSAPVFSLPCDPYDLAMSLCYMCQTFVQEGLPR